MNRALVGLLALSVMLTALLTGCGGGPPAPVRDRSLGGSVPETHIVRRGDTLYSIAFRYRLDHRTVASWNGIGPPYTIYPDQVIWLRPPAAQPRSVASAPRTTTVREGRRGASAGSARPPAKTPPKAQDRSAASARPTPTPAPPQATKAPSGDRVAADIRWVWPGAGGRLLRGFDAGDDSRQGIDVGGKPGQPVLAVADGEVVYSGPGFVGYAELIIIKHSERLLSAYAHNRRRLVDEGERVRAGQQIAELGRSPRGTDEVYVQIRRDGQPQDPLGYLPRD
jgi:lipoprotein NlpD